ARLVIERPASADVMTLLIETSAPEEAEAVAQTLQAVTKLRAAVSCVPADSLPNDGKLIEDRRPIGYRPARRAIRIEDAAAGPERAAEAGVGFAGPQTAMLRPGAAMTTTLAKTTGPVIAVDIN